MDIVITYVNGCDPGWQKQYHETTNAPLSVERFRDWDTLKYLFRGIDKHMPFIENVFLVVAMDSQVPEWINRNKVKIVLHKDIIPEKYLPTFNSCTIEMFLPFIPGLGEQFIYFNDDCFPIRPCREEDFFVNGRPCLFFSINRTAGNQYRKQCRNADAIAKKTAGVPKEDFFLRSQHICTPLLKSKCLEVFEKNEKTVLASLSPLREIYNINQYLYSTYMHYSRSDYEKKIDYSYFSLTKDQWKIRQFFNQPTTNLVCLNDTAKLNYCTFNNFKKNIITSFERRFPKPSKYEG